jgi:hypothetical protein
VRNPLLNLVASTQSSGELHCGKIDVCSYDGLWFVPRFHIDSLPFYVNVMHQFSRELRLQSQRRADNFPDCIAVKEDMPGSCED